MLYFKKLKNKEMATIHGNVTIDEHGVVKGLTKEQEKEFAHLPGFEYHEDKKPTNTKTTKATKSEDKEEPKTTTRKTTRKNTTKKDGE